MTIRYTHSFYWLLLSILLTAGSCSVPPEDEPEIIVGIDPEFVVDLYEARDSSDGRPLFGLWIESIADFPCSDYQLTAAVQQQGSSIEVSLTGIQPPAGCDSLPARAKRFLPVGNLPNGEYALQFNVGPAIENKGNLVVLNGRFTWALPQTAGIDVQNRVLDRIPDGLLWGYVCTTNEQAEPLANQLINDLKTLTDEHNLTPGYYGYFTVAGTGLPFAHRSIAPEGNYKLFVRRVTGDREAIRQLLNTYRHTPQEALEIRCWSTEGDL